MVVDTTPLDTLGEEKQLLQQIENEKHILVEGELVFLVSLNWWNCWKDYVFGSSNVSKPTCISNQELVEYNDQWKEETVSVNDWHISLIYNITTADIIVKADKFARLKSLYPCSLPVERKVITLGLSKKCFVEAYPLSLRVCSESTKQCEQLVLSKATTIRDTKDMVCKKFKLEGNREIRLFNYLNKQKYEELTGDDTRLRDCGLEHGQDILLEVEDQSRKTPSKKEEAKRITNLCTPQETPRGTTGLVNLGNTCFLNSALQCLLHSDIVDFFLQGEYVKEINRHNPIGMRGEIADAVASLMKAMWSGEYSTVAPRELKWKLGKFAPRFSDFDQHDAHEVLSFLLDGLHEDLNRVTDKPYIEVKDDPAVSDEQKAMEAWQNHLRRNNSKIVELFQGQFKSTVTCPDCNKICCTFDPMTGISVPLPVDHYRTLTVTVLHSNSQEPLKVCITLAKTASIVELQEQIAQLTTVDVQKLIIASVSQNRFHRIFKPGDQLSEIRTSDIVYAYIIHENSPFHLAMVQQIVLPVEQRVIKPLKLEMRENKKQWEITNNIGAPYFVVVPRSVSIQDLYNVIIPHSRRYLKSGKEAITDEQLKQILVLSVVDSQHNIVVDLSDKDISCLVSINDNQHLSVEWDLKASKQIFDEEKGLAATVHKASFEQKHNQEKISLHQCIEMFSSAERLEENDSWYCPVCKQHKQATKKMDIWNPPQILIIHLKRFSNLRMIFREKLSTFVEFPTQEVLDLSNFVKIDKEAKYRLFAVINHYGNVFGGHYISVLKNRADDRWYRYDDATVTPVDESSILSEAAYVLFYKKCS